MNVNYDNIWDKLAFQPCSLRSRAQLHMAGAFISFSDCVVLFIFFVDYETHSE